MDAQDNIFSSQQLKTLKELPSAKSNVFEQRREMEAKLGGRELKKKRKAIGVTISGAHANMSKAQKEAWREKLKAAHASPS